MKKVIFVILSTLIIDCIYAQVGKDFDAYIREKFPDAGIPTDRKFYIEGKNPEYVEDVFVFGKMMFIIYSQKDININVSDETIKWTAPSLKHVSDIFDECIDIPYTIPVIINYNIPTPTNYDDIFCETTGSCPFHFVNVTIDPGNPAYKMENGGVKSKILDGDNDSWASISLVQDKSIYDTGIYEDGRWFKEEAYLPIYDKEGMFETVIKNPNLKPLLYKEICREVLHNIGISSYWCEQHRRKYETLCEMERGICDKSHDHSDDACSACAGNLFYTGENAMKANGGLPIQMNDSKYLIGDIFSYSNIENFTAPGSMVYIWNHIGPVTLGILQDIGFKAKQSYLESKYYKDYAGLANWYVIDKRGSAWGKIIQGEYLNQLGPDDDGIWYPHAIIWYEKLKERYDKKNLIEFDLIKPYIKNDMGSSSTGTDKMQRDEIKIACVDGRIEISDIKEKALIQIFDISGKMLKTISCDCSVTYKPSDSGVYLVKINNKTYKIWCN